MLKMDSYLKLRKRKKDSFLTFDHKNGIFDDKIQLLMYNLIIYVQRRQRNGTVFMPINLIKSFHLYISFKDGT